MDPEAVRSQRFLLVRRGYDPEAVQEFLDDVADAFEELRGRLDDHEPPALEAAEARRAVDEARTRAATHRLRAQRDVEALERTARQRRARLLAEIEELAAARDQLSTDLDRAVDVVDRVVQWVRRTDPGAAEAGHPEAAHPGAVGPATPSMTSGPAADSDDEDVATDASEPDAADSDDADVVDQDVEPAEPEADRPDADRQEADRQEADAADAEQADDVVEPDTGASDAQAGPEDDFESDEDPAADQDDPDEPRPEALADRLPDDDVVAVPEDPAVAAVRGALRAVQDEVLANLRDDPRGEVADWLPGPARLESLDDAATPAARAAFHDGWSSAGPDHDQDDDTDTGADGAPGPDAVPSADAREALEDVSGAGHLPGLDVAAGLAVALEASLSRGRDAGDSELALRERVAEVHRDLRQTGLPDAIDRVLAASRHHGQLARWRHDGVEAVAWVVGQEQRCPGRRCRGNATDGVVAPGTPFAFGDLVPPAHPGCTCTLRPAGADERRA